MLISACSPCEWRGGEGGGGGSVTAQRSAAQRSIAQRSVLSRSASVLSSSAAFYRAAASILSSSAAFYRAVAGILSRWVYLKGQTTKMCQFTIVSILRGFCTPNLIVGGARNLCAPPEMRQHFSNALTHLLYSML